MPGVVGGMVGIAKPSLGSAIIKGCGKIPPVKKAALGVATAVAWALGVTVATGIGR